MAARMGVTARVVRAIVWDAADRSCDSDPPGDSPRHEPSFWTGLQARRDGWKPAAGPENSRGFLERVKAARAGLRAGRGVRLEDLS